MARNSLPPASVPSSDREGVSSSTNNNGTRFRRGANAKPRRPLSSYNIFFRRERERILSRHSGSSFIPDDVQSSSGGGGAVVAGRVTGRGGEGKGRGGQGKGKGKGKGGKGKGKIGFVELARQVSERWRTLPPLEKDYYEQLAEAERDRYHAEMDVWDRERVAEAERLMRESEGLEEEAVAVAAAAAQPPPAGTGTPAPAVPPPSSSSSSGVGTKKRQRDDDKQEKAESPSGNAPAPAAAAVQDKAAAPAAPPPTTAAPKDKDQDVAKTPKTVTPPTTAAASSYDVEAYCPTSYGLYRGGSSYSMPLYQAYAESVMAATFASAARGAGADGPASALAGAGGGATSAASTPSLLYGRTGVAAGVGPSWFTNGAASSSAASASSSASAASAGFTASAVAAAQGRSAPSAYGSPSGVASATPVASVASAAPAAPASSGGGGGPAAVLPVKRLRETLGEEECDFLVDVFGDCAEETYSAAA